MSKNKVKGMELKFYIVKLCVILHNLQQLKGGQQLPCSAVSSVNLIVLQLRGEPRGPVVLVTHLHQGLCKGPTNELRLALTTTLRKQAFEAGDGDKTRESEVQVT